MGMFQIQIVSCLGVDLSLTNLNYFFIFIFLQMKIRTSDQSMKDIYELCSDWLALFNYSLSTLLLEDDNIYMQVRGLLIACSESVIFQSLKDVGSFGFYPFKYIILNLFVMLIHFRTVRCVGSYLTRGYILTMQKNQLT